jgi:hypothetical protein
MDIFTETVSILNCVSIGMLSMSTEKAEEEEDQYGHGKAASNANVNGPSHSTKNACACIYSKLNSHVTCRHLLKRKAFNGYLLPKLNDNHHLLQTICFSSDTVSLHKQNLPKTVI